MRLGPAHYLACGVAASLLVACGLFVPPHAPVREQPNASSQPALRGLRISQVGFGRSAYFATCPASSCAAVTPKDLASAPMPGAVVTSLPRPPVAPIPTIRAASAPEHQVDGSLLTERAKSSPPAVSARLTLHFRTNAAHLTSAHKAELDRAFSKLRLSDLIVIAGRTDDRGSDASNQALALARGLAVRDHLLDLDPNLPARISIDARGRCCYAATNESDAGRARNRRVEVAYRQPDREAP
jgi:outer membrane protein OmpA-like peptidoglycan-associated protein